MEQTQFTEKQEQKEGCEKTHQLLYELMASYLGEGRFVDIQVIKRY